MDIATRARWYKVLQDRVLDRTAEVSRLLINILIKVFLRLPEDDALEILSKRVLFLLPIASFVQGIDIITRKDHNIIWLIVFTKDLLEGSEAEFIYAVAHELAHVFLEQPKFQPIDLQKVDEIIDRQEEIAADKQVVKWGFEKELRASPNNYLYGKGFG